VVSTNRSLTLALRHSPILLVNELTNYKPAELQQNLWPMIRTVIIPRPDPFAEMSRPRWI
jgi:hypothetical protein